MNCQSYREWIEDAALEAIDGPRRAELGTHLAACPECRRAMETEQRLYAAIDRALAARVEGMPSSDFARNVRMRLDSLAVRVGVGARASGPPSPERARGPLSWWRPSIWIPALGGAVLALLLLGVWIALRPGAQRLQPPKQQTAHTVLPAPTAATNVRSSVARASRPQPEQASVTRPPVAQAAPRRSFPASGRASGRASGATRRNHGRQSAPDSGAPQLPVQIQPGQWAAVTSLYRAGQAGKLDATEQPVPADKPLQVAPVEVPPLVVAEIQDPKPVGSEPESTNEQDR